MAATAAKARKTGKTAKAEKPARTGRTGINRSARSERATTARKSPKVEKAAQSDEPLVGEVEDDNDEAQIEQLGSDVHSISAREPLRNRLAGDVEAFLAEGGAIVEVPKDFRADPPKRPHSTYGRGSI